MRSRCGVLLWIVFSIVPAVAASPCQDVPFDFIQNQIVLHATIDGKGPYNFLLDTGTRRAMIDTRVVKQLRIPLNGVRNEISGAGSRRVFGKQVTLGELRIGTLVVHGLAADAFDLSALSLKFGRPLDGALGFGFLESRIVQFDYFRRHIRFCSESPFGPGNRPPDTRWRASFPMEFSENSILPVLGECYINRKRLPVTLDTGSGFGLILFPQAIHVLGMEQFMPNGRPIVASGYRGKVLMREGCVRSLRLKTIDLGAVEAAYVERGYGESENPEHRAGNLGNIILQDFLITLDYRHRVVVLEIAPD